MSIRYDGFELVSQKEFEDALPYRDDSLIVACDGLGGSGGSKTTLPLSDASIKEKYTKAATINMELADEAFKAFCDKEIDELFREDRGPGDVFSSAALASRIAVIRYAYAVKYPFLLQEELDAYEAEKEEFVKKEKASRRAKREEERKRREEELRKQREEEEAALAKKKEEEEAARLEEEKKRREEGFDISFDDEEPVALDEPTPAEETPAPVEEEPLLLDPESETPEGEEKPEGKDTIAFGPAFFGAKKKPEEPEEKDAEEAPIPEEPETVEIPEEKLEEEEEEDDEPIIYDGAKPEPRSAKLSDDGDRARIIAFIRDGFFAVAKALDLKQPTIANSFLLPSTLASAVVTPLEGGKLRVEALWSGDSRVYAFVRGKLWQLSKDDEDKSKIMNNFLSARLDKVPTLNRLCYNGIPTPCLIFACSDGVFDPFGGMEGLGVRTILAQTCDGTKSYGEWKAKFPKVYDDDGHRGDDISIAVNAYGYASFEEAQAEVVHGLAAMNESFRLAIRYRSVFPLIDHPVEVAPTYVRGRTDAVARNRPQFFEVLENTYLEGKEDPALTPAIREIFDEHAPSEKHPDKKDVDIFLDQFLDLVFFNGDTETEDVFVDPESPLAKQYGIVFDAAGTTRGKFMEEFRLFEALVASYSDDWSAVFKPEYLAELDFDFPMPVKATPDERRAMLDGYIRSHLDQLIPLVIDALEDHCNEESVLHQFFNQDQLKRWRLDMMAFKGLLPQEMLDVREVCRVYDDESLNQLKSAWNHYYRESFE